MLDNISAKEIAETDVIKQSLLIWHLWITYQRYMFTCSYSHEQFSFFATFKFLLFVHSFQFFSLFLAHYFLNPFFLSLLVSTPWVFFLIFFSFFFITRPASVPFAEHLVFSDIFLLAQNNIVTQSLAPKYTHWLFLLFHLYPFRALWLKKNKVKGLSES